MESNAQARVRATSPRGFTGFNERVSDVSSDVRAAAAAAAEGTARQWPTQLEDDHWATDFLEGRAPKKPVVKAAVEGGAGFLGWILAQRGGFFILIGGAIWLFSTCASFFEKPKGSSIDTYRPSVTASSAGLSTPPPAPYSPPRDDYTESKPMVGNGLKLSGAEVRYCVFEKVRLTKMRSLAKSNFQIDRFNDFVADYNARCGNFQYVPWTRDLAERQARERDAELAAEARAKLGIKARGGGK